MSNRSVRSPNPALMLAALCALPAGPALGQSVMVKRAYVPGRVVYVERETVAMQDISGMPFPPMKFQVKELYGLWEEVESATSDKATIVLTFDRAARNVEAPAVPMMGNAEFDTDDPDYEEAAPQLGAVLMPMIGMKINMEVDKNGEIVSFTGMDAINKKVSEHAIASMHWEQMKEDFSDERGQESWGREPLLIYPNKQVKLGDTWEGSMSVDRPPMGTFVTNYKFKVDRIGLEDGRNSVVISVEGLVSAGPEAEGKPEKAQEAGPKTEVSGSLSGTGIYDVELGQVVNRTIKGNVDIRIPLAKLIPNLPATEEPQFADFKIGLTETTRVLPQKEREAQKEEARKRAEARRLAEEEEDEGDEEEDDE